MFSVAAAVFRRFFSFLGAVRLLVRILCMNSECDSAARGELRGDHCFARRACFDEIVKNPICDCLVKRALIPIRCQIKLERLAFDAEPIGHVINIDPCEIGLTCDRANGCEVVGFKMNSIIPVQSRIWECLEERF